MKYIISFFVALSCANIAATISKIDNKHAKFQIILKELPQLHNPVSLLPNQGANKTQIINKVPNDERLFIEVLNLQRKYYLFSTVKDSQILLEKLKKYRYKALCMSWYFAEYRNNYRTIPKNNYSKNLLFKLPDAEYDQLIEKQIDTFIRSKY